MKIQFVLFRDVGHTIHVHAPVSRGPDLAAEPLCVANHVQRARIHVERLAYQMQ